MDEQKDLNSLLAIYSKILIIDFNTGEYRACKVPANEQNRPTSLKIKDYWNWFINDSGLLHNDDVQAFTEFTERPLEIKYCCYKRLVGGEWRKCLMEIRACQEKQTYVLLVKDITSIYEQEADKVRSHDDTTDCFNHYALDRDIAKYKCGNIGIIFADINGLKFINDKKEHHAGDEHILKFVQRIKDRFSDCKIYRRGGDEFVIIGYGVKLRHFVSRARAFHKEIWRAESDEFPIASIGYAVDIEAIDEVIDQAEEAMYYDKAMFKKFYPQYKR